MREHSGGGLSMGRGFSITASIKQKLNTRNSTETEIVGTDDFIPFICWTRYFLETQDYSVKINTLFQNNKRNIFLEKNNKYTPLSVIIYLSVYTPNSEYVIT